MKRSRTILCASAATAVVLAVCASSWGASEPLGSSMPIAGGPEYMRVRICAATLTFEQFVRQSTHVVVGEVVGSRPIAAPQGLDFTSTTFVVHDWIKGTGADTIELRVAGAILPERETVVDGVPSLPAGERCVLFLQRMTGADAYGIVGLERGVNRFVTGADGSERVRGAYSFDELPENFLDRIRMLVAEEE